MGQEKILEALEDLKLLAQKINSQESLIIFKNSTVNNIVRIYGKDSEQEKQVKALKSTAVYTGNSIIPQTRMIAENLIDNIIKEIERFGPPEISTPSGAGLNITIAQTQNQSVKVNLSLIVESIREELTVDQLKEIQEIIDNKQLVASEKKKSIMQKIVSFGKDVGANIVANIVTNPDLYT